MLNIKVSPSPHDSATEILEINTTQAWQEINIKSPNNEQINNNEQNNNNYSALQIIIIFLEIILLPLIFSFSAIGLPLSEPIPGIEHNWRFAIIATITTALVVVNYVWWCKQFTGVTTFVPVIVTALINGIITLGLSASPSWPIKANGVVLCVSLGIFYIISFKFYSSYKGLHKDPKFQEGYKRFAQFRLMLILFYVLWMAYIIIFNVFNHVAVQMILPVLFAVFTFLFKYFICFHNMKHVKNTGARYLIVYWVEIFYELFTTLALPSVSSVSVYVIMSLLKIGVIFLPFVTMTPWWQILSDNIQAYFSSGDQEKGYEKSESDTFISFLLSPPPKEGMNEFIFSNFVNTALSHAIAPLYYASLLLILRYGYNKPYFPFRDIPDHEFERGFIYVGVTLAASLVSYLFCYLVCIKVLNITFTRDSFKDIFEYKWSYIASNVNVLLMPCILLLNHTQIYYLFVN